MNIKGRFITLRSVEINDLPMLQEMMNDPEIEGMVVGWSFPISMYQQTKWYESILNDNSNQRFIIETKDSGACGLATLVDIDWKNGNATHGIKLAKKENREKGVGTDAVMAIMRYAFDELRLNRLSGSWFEYNVPSKALYTKCGWVVEGASRQCIYKNGKYHDLSIVGILASDYYKLIEVNKYWD
jgi:RimJ/RimL family protein N-acetyltransferase